MIMKQTLGLVMTALGSTSNNNTTKTKQRRNLFRRDGFSQHMNARGGDDTTTFAGKKNSIVLNAGAGGLTLVGGLIGFLTKGSKASLIAGSSMGGMLLLSAFLISRKVQLVGNILGSFFASLLSLTMVKKFMSSKKLFPPGVLTLLGSLAVVVNLYEAVSTISTYLSNRKRSSTTEDKDVDEEEKE